MRVDVVDPSAYTPPYDHALCRALGVGGAEVRLVTSDFAYGEPPRPEHYARLELFYRLAVGRVHRHTPVKDLVGDREAFIHCC